MSLPSANAGALGAQKDMTQTLTRIYRVNEMQGGTVNIFTVVRYSDRLPIRLLFIKSQNTATTNGSGSHCALHVGNGERERGFDNPTLCLADEAKTPSTERQGQRCRLGHSKGL